jgi:hypothetical protein
VPALSARLERTWRFVIALLITLVTLVAAQVAAPSTTALILPTHTPRHYSKMTQARIASTICKKGWAK